MDESFKKLNGPSADSIQSDYIEKEKRAADALLTIQLKNAQTLADLRKKLLTQLFEEAEKEGQKVEEVLAEYGLQKRLEALDKELKERQKGYDDHIKALTSAYDQMYQKLTQAEDDLATHRIAKNGEVLKSREAGIKNLYNLERTEIEKTIKLRSSLLSGDAVVEEIPNSATAELAEINTSNLSSVELQGSLTDLDTSSLSSVELHGILADLDTSAIGPITVQSSIAESEARAIQERIKGVQTLQILEQGIVNLRAGAEEQIIQNRLALLANQSTPAKESADTTDSSAILLKQLHIETRGKTVAVEKVELTVEAIAQAEKLIETEEKELSVLKQRQEIQLQQALADQQVLVAARSRAQALRESGSLSSEELDSVAQMLRQLKEVAAASRTLAANTSQEIVDKQALVDATRGALGIETERVEATTSAVQAALKELATREAAAQAYRETVQEAAEQVGLSEQELKNAQLRLKVLTETASATEEEKQIQADLVLASERAVKAAQAQLKLTQDQQLQKEASVTSLKQGLADLAKEAPDLINLVKNQQILDTFTSKQLTALHEHYDAEIVRIQQTAEYKAATAAEQSKMLQDLAEQETAQTAELEKAKLAVILDSYKYGIQLDEAEAQRRIQQILDLSKVEQAEAEKQAKLLDALRKKDNGKSAKDRLAETRQNNKSYAASAFQRNSTYEAEMGSGGLEALASLGDVATAIGSFKEDLLKRAAQEDAKQQQQLENTFKGLWNMGHSLEEIEHVFSNYGDIASNDTEAISAKATEVAREQVTSEYTTQANEQLDQRDGTIEEQIVAKIEALSAEGKEVDYATIEQEILALRAQAVREELATRKDAMSAEIAERARLEEENAKKALADADKSRKAQERLDKKKQFEESKLGKSKVGSLITEANFGKDLQAKVDAGEMTQEDAQGAAQAKLDQTFAAIGNWVNQLAEQGKTAAKKQSSIDTNLQGSVANKTVLGSYWRKLDATITMGVGVSPFILQENVAASVEKLTGMGISFNIQQRALMDTLKDKIATTFDAADGTMLKLIRIQQADTTAARLGMESALTSFLNSMYETSEFMHTTAASIRDNLYQATALMGAKEATAYEYQVQKWMGSLYSVGFSATEKVSEALGKLTAGDISGITDGGMGNLLVMAANEASLPIADILEKGLDADQTDRLMESMVNYLGNIYEETKGSRVLAQQYGNVFGVTAADLKAVANLGADTISTIAKHDRDYAQMLKQLENMSNTMVLRTSTAEMFENIKTNFSYSMATTLANNPVLSGINMMANMLNDLVGGIEIPFVNVYGFGFDLNATVADLMNVAALSGAVLGGMGKVVASLAGGGGFSGSGMLRMFGVDQGNNLAELQRGNGGLNLTTLGGATQSESGAVAGNESGEDIQNKTLADASEGPEKQIAEAKEEQEDKEETRHNAVVEQIVQIYDLLDEVTKGVKKWHVHLDVGNNPTSWSTGTWN